MYGHAIIIDKNSNYFEETGVIISTDESEDEYVIRFAENETACFANKQFMKISETVET